MIWHQRKDPDGIIQDFVDAVETLRVRRRNEYQGRPHDMGKRFSQEELYLLVPSYKNLLVGRTQRLITCAGIMQIANYLECSRDETNELLLAAQYAPEPIDLYDDEYKAALAHGRTVLETLLMPASLVSYGWYREAVNAAFLQTYQLPPLEDFGRYAIPTFFDPASPFHAWVAPTWEANAPQLVWMFKQMHRAYQNAAWLQTALQSYRRLPDFAPIWQTTYEAALLGVIKTHLPATILTEQWLITPLSTATFPLIILHVPLDETTRHW